MLAKQKPTEIDQIDIIQKRTYMYTHIHLNSIHIYIPRMTAVSHTISQTNVTQIQSGLHHVHYLPFGGPDKKTKVRHQKFINQETKYI